MLEKLQSREMDRELQTSEQTSVDFQIVGNGQFFRMRIEIVVMVSQTHQQQNQECHLNPMEKNF